jgi:hypothetical protein
MVFTHSCRAAASGSLASPGQAYWLVVPLELEEDELLVLVEDELVVLEEDELVVVEEELLVLVLPPVPEELPVLVEPPVPVEPPVLDEPPVAEVLPVLDEPPTPDEPVPEEVPAVVPVLWRSSIPVMALQAPRSAARGAATTKRRGTYAAGTREGRVMAARSCSGRAMV